MKIIVDFQESRNCSLDLLKEKVDVEVKKLEVGDFIISDDVVVERKTTNDFINSLIDGRLFVQSKNMKENYKIPIFLIEGNFGELFLRRVPNKAIWSSIISLMLKQNIRFLFSSSYKETVEILSLLAKKEQVDEKKEISLRCKKKKLDFNELQQFFLEGLPGVGPKLANRLLKKFGTPHNVINASDEELLKVAKLGPKKLKLINKIIRNRK